MIAECGETPIAGAYGTFVEPLRLLHLNFLGRRIRYPGVHIMETLQDHLGTVQARFPQLKCLTFCVHEQNPHARASYESLGFELLEYVEQGYGGKPMSFFGKKLDDDAILPCYQDFRQAYTTARKPYLPSC